MKKEGLFSHFEYATVRRYKDIIEVAKDFDIFWDSPMKFIHLLPWQQKIKEQFIFWKQHFDQERAIDTLNTLQISCIEISNPAYPSLLKQITDPPICLFVRGTLLNLDQISAVVGTRKYTSYGQRVTEQITKTFAINNCTLISGLALGIDAIAHHTAITHGIRTIAVVAGGVDEDSLSPKPNIRLSQKILQDGGAIISEYPPGFKPETYTFPRRNRIIAGLSQEVIVTEAPMRSGALITAHLALDYNREVAAIPHSIENIQGMGCNDLIANGARCIYNIAEMFTASSSQQHITTQKQLSLSPIEQKIYQVLSFEPTGIKQILQKVPLSEPQILSTLTKLEISDVIKNIGGMQYILC